MTDDGGCLLFFDRRTDIQFFSVFQDMTEVRPLLVLSGPLQDYIPETRMGIMDGCSGFLLIMGNIK